MTEWGDFEWDDDDTPTEPPQLEVEIDGPEIVGVLLDHRGEEAWTLYDRRIVPFGYQPREVEP